MTSVNGDLPNTIELSKHLISWVYLFNKTIKPLNVVNVLELWYNLIKNTKNQ